MREMQPMNEAQARKFWDILAAKCAGAKFFVVATALENQHWRNAELANLIRDYSVASAFTCPVCGFRMRDEPDNYNICPSCGTEFNLHDLNSSIEDLRAAWLATGPKWWAACTAEAEPEGWNPMEQLKAVTE